MNIFSSTTHQVFVIAEIGNNHNGNFDWAVELIDVAKESGADCVKFQLRNMDSLYRKTPADDAEDLGVEYVKDLLARMQLDPDRHLQLRKYCKQKGITYCCSPWDLKSLKLLETFEPELLKIASADLTNHPLIHAASQLNLPLVVSTGMSTDEEILQTVGLLNSTGAIYALLHCNSTYPAAPEDIQLPYLKKLGDLHGFIGYSGHERGIAVSYAAVALGARIIERHITLDRSLEGPDHLASLEPTELKLLVNGIRDIEKALQGSSTTRHFSQGERLNRENLGKSVVCARALSIGDSITTDDLEIKSPGRGLSPARLNELLGKRAKRVIHKGDFLFESDLSDLDLTDNNMSAKTYRFPLPWGIPVRFHDAKRFLRQSNPDFVEFHLSYADMHCIPADYLDSYDHKRIIVHAPELFENSELLDLVSEDDAYQKRSIENLNAVFRIGNSLRQHIPEAAEIFVVANVGGFSKDAPISESKRNDYYSILLGILHQLECRPVELLIQNMAPFPWHFGGQRFQNLFVFPNEIIQFCERENTRICLDISHLMMTCNHFDLDFLRSVESLLPHTAHLHIADAKGVNGEGLQIGEGDIPWPEVWQMICKYPNISFIPEIWQGHKDHGAGFWRALQTLETLLVSG